jgi:hypothetical protein
LFCLLQHPLLASALARIAEDSENRAYIGRDEGAIRQLLSMVLSDDTHVVQQACKALSSIAMDTTLVARLVKADVLQSIWAVLGSKDPEIQVGDWKRFGGWRFGDFGTLCEEGRGFGAYG